MTLIAVADIGADIVGLEQLLLAVGFVLLVVLIAFRSQVRELVNLRTTRVLANENKLMEVTNAMTAEIQLLPLLRKVVESITDILEADRSTLFLYDEKTGELWSQVAEGINTKEIRFPSDAGIAGSVFTSGETVNIKDVYKDSRFNQAVDKKTGYRTRSMLCLQIRNKFNVPIGVVQVLNKQGGAFSDIDEKRLRAFSAKAAIAIENSKLFDALQRIKNYNEAMLESMRNGIVSVDEDGKITKANSSALRLFESDESIIGIAVEEFFLEQNSWLASSVQQILQTGETDENLDVTLFVGAEEQKEVSVNITIQPLRDEREQGIGCLLVFEDITDEKRLRTTMLRFLPKEVANRLLEQREQSLGGSLQTATILFSDIRQFTRFSERNGPQQTVKMLNAYFTVMYEQIIQYQGILDKYIGDAIMALFGVPFNSDMDANNAVYTAISMIKALESFNENRVAQELEPIDIGIGINTGEVVSGNIGSEKRMDYTVIGDGVNLAARLEGATKVYQTPILISEGTKRCLTVEFQLRELDWLRVKGKDQPVAIFEVLDVMPPEKLERIQSNLEMYQQALGLYRNCKWEDAIERFQQFAGVTNDYVASMYIDRCRYLIANPPDATWDGVWAMKTK